MEKNIEKIKKKKNIFLPLIATRGIVLFPKHIVMIEIGRKKSINAIKESEKKHNKKIVIVSQKNIFLNDPKIKDFYTVGTLSKIKKIKKKNGFFHVTFLGIKRVKIKNVKLLEKQNFFVTLIKCLNNIKGDKNQELALVRNITTEIKKITLTKLSIPEIIINQLTLDISPSELSDQFAQFFPLKYQKKQFLLETLEINKRLMYIVEEIKNEKKVLSIEKDINKKVKDKVESSQREYYLREKLRAIKEELGEISENNSEIEEYKRMLKKFPYPKHVKIKAYEELARYESMPQISGEHSILRTYLDWLLKLPWWKESKDQKNLKVIRKKLDKEHHGLKKVKNRIIEYLAVKNITNSLKAPILIFVGPPGVGKTSLAYSIAKSLNRKFVKISLGGVRDEAEIRGHRRTYLGSMPGRIIQGLKKAGVVNPVFLIDELDKTASDFKGDPSSAMLEVLDPEQNKMFSDHYLEETYDLSKVMFIATANYLEDISAPLRDRLEVINLSSYTEEEKLIISKKHLIPKQLKNNGLKKKYFKVSDNCIKFIIRHYTREAGVRELERKFAALIRKSVINVINDKKKVILTKKKIRNWLGNIIFEYGRKEKKNQIGVTTGLAYTPFGGDVLPIEVTYFNGKGKLIMTGQLGNVMVESAKIACSYVKSQSKKLKISKNFFYKHDIHIHAPEGAVQKDGPSAGIALVTSIISAIIKKKVFSDIAMTGEITLRGNVLQIGGLKEKSLAAYRCGIYKIIIPKTNSKDLNDIPKLIRKKIKFIFVESIGEVIKNALEK